MVVTSFIVRLLSIDSTPYYRSAKTPPEHSTRWEFPLVEVTTDAGISGYSMGRGTGGQGRALAYALRDAYGYRLLGIDPVRQHEFIWQHFKRENRHFYSLTDAALGTIDVALWDIRGKAAGLPIAALLGQYREKVPTYATINRQTLETPEAVREQCAAARAAGFTAIKIQFWNGPDRDIPRLQAARDSVGPAFRLMFDAAGGYQLTEAMRVGSALSELGYYWFEEPVPDAQIGNLRELRRRVRVPILAAETARLSELHSYLLHEAVDMIRGDVHITAGITGLRKACAMAELFGLNLEIHAAGASLLDAAHIHVACAMKNCEYVEVPPPVFRFGLVERPIDSGPDGLLACPTAPGLGVELDWDWINAHTVLTLDCSDA